MQQAEAHCDFPPNKMRISYRSSTKSLCLAKYCRHKERNFASLISARLATLLGVNFYENLAERLSKHRIGAVFTFGSSLAERLHSKNQSPISESSNIIVFEDVVTTDATMISMRNLLMPLHKNLVFFTTRNSKL